MELILALHYINQEMENLFTNNSHKPLAEKLRPKSLDEFVGQEHILGSGKLLRRIIRSDRIIPMIFWGPPGSGKTTLAKIIASNSKSNFIFFSAVSQGVSEVRKIIEKAKIDLELTGQRTILFVDEIHRFNRSQQDAFLPYVENGTIILLGATTENPSFEVNAPLLSRARVFHFREISTKEVIKILKSAIRKINSSPKDFFSFSFKKIEISEDALKYISELCEGDLRDAYNALELAILSVTPKKGLIKITQEIAEESFQRKFIRYDKAQDGHFDAISALHKSLRSSDVDAALHYLARMLEAGEDPMYIVRRLIRFASEDIGLADSNALVLATGAANAVHQLGMPECNVILAHLVIYLAEAPKSRAVNDAYEKAKYDILSKRLDPIPLDIRNAPTKLMKEFGFGKGYQMYDKKSHLPENLINSKYWNKKDEHQ